MAWGHFPAGAHTALPSRPPSCPVGLRRPFHPESLGCVCVFSGDDDVFQNPGHGFPEPQNQRGLRGTWPVLPRLPLRSEEQVSPGPTAGLPSRRGWNPGRGEPGARGQGGVRLERRGAPVPEPHLGGRARPGPARRLPVRSGPGRRGPGRRGRPLRPLPGLGHRAGAWPPARVSSAPLAMALLSPAPRGSAVTGSRGRQKAEPTARRALRARGTHGLAAAAG